MAETGRGSCCYGGRGDGEEWRKEMNGRNPVWAAKLVKVWTFTRYSRPGVLFQEIQDQMKEGP